MYATIIYYSYHKETVLSKLLFIKFYQRLINDAFAIIEDTNIAFDSLLEAMSDYAPEDKRLAWEPEMQGKHVHFLDLWIKIDIDHLSTSMFQKPANLYLYCCPFSAQLPYILYGLIYGTMHRYYWHNTSMKDFDTLTKLLFNRLTDRTHRAQELAPLFIKAAQEI